MLLAALYPLRELEHITHYMNSNIVLTTCSNVLAKRALNQQWNQFPFYVENMNTILLQEYEYKVNNDKSPGSYSTFMLHLGHLCTKQWGFNLSCLL